MTPLKIAIFTEIRNNNAAFCQLNDEKLNDLIFHHRSGLRLSSTGMAMLKKIFTAYVFEIPETIKAKHQFGMSKMEFPYFFTKRRLVLFSEMDAMVIKLHGGIEGFLENYSQMD